MADERDKLDSHAELIGRVVISWNEVQWIIYRLFVGFSGMPEQQAQDVFFALRSEGGQRDLALAAGKTALADYPFLWEQFRTSLCEVRRLAGERNAAIQTMWDFNFEALHETHSIEVGTLSDTERHKSLQADFPARCNELREQLEKQFWILSKIYKQLYVQHRTL